MRPSANRTRENVALFFFLIFVTSTVWFVNSHASSHAVNSEVPLTSPTPMRVVAGKHKLNLIANPVLRG